MPLPNLAVLKGVRAGLQAVLGPTAAPLGADVSHALVWTLGF